MGGWVSCDMIAVEWIQERRHLHPSRQYLCRHFIEMPSDVGSRIGHPIKTGCHRQSDRVVHVCEIGVVVSRPHDIRSSCSQPVCSGHNERATARIRLSEGSGSEDVLLIGVELLSLQISATVCDEIKWNLIRADFLVIAGNPGVLGRWGVVTISLAERRDFVHVVPNSIKRNVSKEWLILIDPILFDVGVAKVWEDHVAWPDISNVCFVCVGVLQVHSRVDEFFVGRIIVKRSDSWVDDPDRSCSVFLSLILHISLHRSFWEINWVCGEDLLLVEIVNIIPDDVQRHAIVAVRLRLKHDLANVVKSPTTIVEAKCPLWNQAGLADKVCVLFDNILLGRAEEDVEIQHSSHRLILDAPIIEADEHGERVEEEDPVRIPAVEDFDVERVGTVQFLAIIWHISAMVHESIVKRVW
ncbi:hypothetical protein BLNAU_17341 [Blattamonas nauphoetae]|uniref:Uncharacterized protein n=1 Tax=Blattamonas nauphoetae TaxID=2049346 RepID=A0ABQ9XBU6_9EUKA|nr:hypothetical protein BLNAU_17341 [Blattamonas nauphoetae]